MEIRKLTIRIPGEEPKALVTNSAEETETVAKNIARSLKGGTVVALQGDLGAGKTTFVKGFAKGLGVSETVTSPTFVLMNVYKAHKEGVSQFVHIDCYRLENASDLLGIGVKDYLSEPHTIVALEWPERVKKILPKSTIQIEFNLD